MSASDGKPIIGHGSLFGGLFGPGASKRANKKYQRAVEEAARKLAAHDAEAGSKPASN